MCSSDLVSQKKKKIFHFGNNGFHANVKDGNFVNSGIGTDIQQIDSVDNGFNANDKDGTLSTSMDRIKGNSNLNHEAGIAPHLSITNWASGIIGPLSSKPKATWTRINRMDFGLSGFY